MIIICIRGELFKIPNPLDLILKPRQVIIHVHPKIGTKEYESREFFINNSEVFQHYLQTIINKEKLPPNFYTYIDSILYFIKINNKTESVDNYWRQLL